MPRGYRNDGSGPVNPKGGPNLYKGMPSPNPMGSLKKGDGRIKLANSPYSGRYVTQALMLELASKATGLKGEKGDPAAIRTLRHIVGKQITAALNGDLPATHFIADRIDGKAAQALTGADGGDITVVIKKFVLGATEPDGEDDQSSE